MFDGDGVEVRQLARPFLSPEDLHTVEQAEEIARERLRTEGNRKARRAAARARRRGRRSHPDVSLCTPRYSTEGDLPPAPEGTGDVDIEERRVAILATMEAAQTQTRWHMFLDAAEAAARERA